MRPNRQTAGGSAGSGGYDFQARVVAYIAAHIIAVRRLDWLEGRNDAPLAVAAETVGPGDDIRIEFDNGTVDVQVKRGLDRTGLRDVIRRFAGEVRARPAAEIVLLVDSERSSSTIRSDLRVDLTRIRQGRRDELKAIARDVLSVLAEEGVSDPYSAAARIHVVELQLETAGAAHDKGALGLLREVYEEEDHRTAWKLLIADGHALHKVRGRRDRSSLLALLGAENVRQLSRPLMAAAESVPRTEGSVSTRTVGAAQKVLDPWHQRIDEAAKLIRSGQARAGLRVLEQIELEARSTTVDQRAHYRLYSNLAAANADLGRLSVAEDLLRKALDYEQGDVTARVSLAQVRLARDDRSDAERLAREVLEREPNSTTAWSVLIQASQEAVPEERIPAAIREEFEVLTARAMSLWRRGDHSRSLEFFRRALQRKRDPQLLVLLSQSLFSSGALEEVERYLSEAIQALSEVDRPALLEEALLLRGLVRTREAAHVKAREDLDCALKIPGHSWRVDAAVGRNRLALDRPHEALAALEEIDEPDARTEISLLKALAYAQLGNAAEARRCAEAVLEEGGRTPQENADVLLGSVEVALNAGYDDLAEGWLKRLASDTPDFRVPLFEGRLAARRKVPDRARQAYQRAVAMANASQRRLVQAEYGKYLLSCGDYQAAIEILEQAGPEHASSDVRRDYSRALYRAREISKVLAFLSKEKGGDDTPIWALELQARISVDREDWPGAITVLSRLQARAPTVAWVLLTLVEALIHEGQRERALQLLLEFVKRDNAEADALMAAAHLLAQFDRFEESLAAAFRSVRMRPDDPRLRLAYAKSFVEAEKRNPPVTPAAVAPDTWVQLRSAQGAMRDYLILREGPVDAQRGEVLATEAWASKLLGRGVGDWVTFRPGAPDEEQMEVLDIRGATVRVFQQTFAEFRRWFPDDTSLQSFPVGDGRLDEFTPIIANLQQRATFVEEMFGLYNRVALPLGLLASTLGSRVRAVYEHLARQPTGRLLVEVGDTEATAQAYEQAASSSRAVLTVSALLSWQHLGLLDLLPRLFASVLVPQSLLDELEEEERELMFQAELGGGTIAWIRDRIVMQEPSKEWTEKQLAEIRGLSTWVRANAQREPRPLAALAAEGDEVRSRLGSSSYDALALAKEHGAPLLADDLGLRRVAAGEYGLASFSSFTVLTLAKDRQLLDEAAMGQATTTLVQLNHEFIPVWADLLYAELSRRQFQIDGEVIRLFERLRGGRADTAPALRVGVELLKRVALSVTGDAVLGAVADLCFEALTGDRDSSAPAEIAAEIHRQTMLLPLQQSRLLTRLKAFLAAKALSRESL